MKWITGVCLILFYTNVYGQQNTERVTRKAKVVAQWTTEKKKTLATEIYHHYEIEVEGNDNECGNWLLVVGLAEYDEPNPLRPTGPARIEVKFATDFGRCSSSRIYIPTPGKEVHNDGNISTSINFRQGRGVKVEKTKDGYRLIELKRKTMTGKMIETFVYE